MKHRVAGEDALHDIFRSAFRRRKDLPVGPGQDCAVLRLAGGRPVALTSDQVVAGVHLEAASRPEVFARKLVGRTLSDLAAAGARPWILSWTAAVPARFGLAWMRRLARAFLREAARFDAAVIGGDLSTGPGVVLGCTALGKCGRRPPPGRGGARTGDRLWVTGRLGDAVHSGRHLRPVPRLAEGAALVSRFGAHALMDLSDGLARDLPRMLRASRRGARVELEHLPLSRGLRRDRAGWESAIGEGEDYELLAALPPAAAEKARRSSVLAQAGFTEIGEILPASRGLVWEWRGRPQKPRAGGWEHRWK